MGLLRGQAVHYRQTGSANSCRAGRILVDDPADNTTVDLESVAIVIGVAVSTVHTDVVRPDEPPFTDADTWHYPLECPDYE